MVILRTMSVSLKKCRDNIGWLAIACLQNANDIFLNIEKYPWTFSFTPCKLSPACSNEKLFWFLLLKFAKVDPSFHFFFPQKKSAYFLFSWLGVSLFFGTKLFLYCVRGGHARKLLAMEADRRWRRPTPQTLKTHNFLKKGETPNPGEKYGLDFAKRLPARNP